MLNKNTLIPFKIGDQRYKIANVEYVYDHFRDDDFKLWTNMGWREAKALRVPTEQQYIIVLNGNLGYFMGESQLQPVLNQGEQPVEHLIIGDFLPFCQKPFRSRYQYEYRKIIDIDEFESTDKYLYKFEIDTKDNYYMIQHNLLIKAEVNQCI